MKHIFTLFISCLIIFNSYSQENFQEGVFILNEDWYTHNNSTINFISNENEVYYRCFQKANNKNAEFGATAQYGTIYGDKLIVMSKQDIDPGDDIQGGRVTIANALTLENIIQHPMLESNPKTGNSIADGRACLGVDENTAYLGSSNGIYIFDLQTLKIIKKIEDTSNPLITGDENNADGTGPLYQNQIGVMIRGTDYVFAVYQDRGILVIDPKSHSIIKEIPGSFSTMTQSKDGYIWAAQNMNSNPEYLKYPYGPIGSEWKGTGLKKINQHTLEETDITLPKEYQIPQSWYAWTAGVLHASKRQNVLYWVQSGGWFTGEQTTKIYKYNIETGTISKFFDLADENSNYSIYAGAGIGINPLDDKMYVAVQEGDIENSTFFIFQLNNEGEVLNRFPLIRNWWYPAMLIAPDKYAPEILSSFPNSITISKEMNNYKLYLGDKVSDKDNFNGSIVKSIVSISDELSCEAQIKNDTLTIIPIRENNKINERNLDIQLKFNSNGKVITQLLSVKIEPTATGVESTTFINNSSLAEINNKNNYVSINMDGNVEIYAMNGMKVYTNNHYKKESKINTSNLSQGTYILKVNNQTLKFIKK